MQELFTLIAQTLISMGYKLGIFIACFALVLLFFVYLGDKFFPKLNAAFKDILRLAKPYFMTSDKGDFSFLGVKSQISEKTFAWSMLIALILINTFQVELQVIFNEWGRRFYDAIQKKDAANFWIEIGLFIVIAGIHIFTAVLEFYMMQMLVMRWRQWYTAKTATQWLDNHAHYRMALLGNIDNPDQRISDDVNKFTQTTVDLVLQFFSSFLSIGAFTAILWGLSASFNYKIGNFNLTSIPGYLVWAAIIYIGIGTLITHLIGKRLVPLDFKREATEANFRFELARKRENGEPIALLKGEGQEKASLLTSFSHLMGVWYDVVRVRIQMVWFTHFWGQLSVILPYFLLAPAYFATDGGVTFGNLQQTKGAMGRLESALNVIIDKYSTLADFRATVNRLISFQDAIAKTQVVGDSFTHATGENIVLNDFSVALPNGKTLVKVTQFTFKQHENLLLTGASGSGKSTILRAIAGIWNYGSGTITTPRSMMVIPQKPYLPLGSLRDALNYPSTIGYSDTELKTALTDAELSHLVEELDVTRMWHLTLSGGEQQRLSLARAFLAKPAWLLLDEATASMDEPTEAKLYASLKTLLPQTTIVSIGHRSTLIAMHDRQVMLVKQGDVFGFQG